jgi:hypothetical protein
LVTCPAEAQAVRQVRRRVAWSYYAIRLLQNLQATLKKHNALEKLRFLLYPSGLMDEHVAWVNANPQGVKKLGEVAAWGNSARTGD